MMVLVMKSDRPPPVALVPGLTSPCGEGGTFHRFELEPGLDRNPTLVGSEGSPRTDRHSSPSSNRAQGAAATDVRLGRVQILLSAIGGAKPTGVDFVFGPNRSSRCAWRMSSMRARSCRYAWPIMAQCGLLVAEVRSSAVVMPAQRGHVKKGIISTPSPGKTVMCGWSSNSRAAASALSASTASSRRKNSPR